MNGLPDNLSTPGITMPGWLGILLVVVPVVGIGAWLVWGAYKRWRLLEDAWKPLPGPWAGAQYIAPADRAPSTIVEALETAAQVLSGHRVWTYGVISNALQSVKVWVINADSWVDAEGRHVGGEEFGEVLQVDKSLSSLCHEMAHFLELVIDRTQHPNHETWAARGINDAIADYNLWLAKKDAEAANASKGPVL